ncbi:hypothetical protein DCAR_0520195 [Daucus carota subsp. sativus]|uniref:AT-hook motif nuclear-localized protein n=1 Tax=Daucus carota subsp. sativus TaxID=79200 RepID=A0A162A0R8_DAUCS|nr:PREDICTED: AT-hook motif nuclear-localized protein 29-like [Daucus carota subsp. sativus]WOH00820.1 hypothetical protein DCAR_0520195 [Daucus carota subsp. sativus]
MEGNNNHGEGSSLQQLPPNPRQRGRPPGSKNKPKPPTVVTRDSPDALRSHVLEVPAGADIMESLNNYATQRGRGVCVLYGRGMVSNVTIREPASSVATFHGAFEILSLTGVLLPLPAPPGIGGLSVLLRGREGRVLGGHVVGPLTATGTVVVMAASFGNAVYERLTLDGQRGAAQGDSGEGASQVQRIQPAASEASDGTGSVPLFNAGPPSFPNLFEWGASDAAAPRPPF